MLKTFFERNQDRKSEHRQTAGPAVFTGSAVCFLAVCIRLVNCGVLPTARFGDGLLPMRENKTPAVIVGMRSGNCKV